MSVSIDMLRYCSRPPLKSPKRIDHRGEEDHSAMAVRREKFEGFAKMPLSAEGEGLRTKAK